MSDYPEPTPEMLDGDPLFEAIWQAIKGWDISRHNDGLYSGPTGNDTRHIYDAIKPRIEELEAALREIAGNNPSVQYWWQIKARAALTPEQCPDCGQYLPLRYPCQQQGCPALAPEQGR